MLRIFFVVLVLCTAAHSEEKNFRGSSEKVKAAQNEIQNSDASKQISAPADSPAPTTISIYPNQHNEEKSSCATNKNTTSWGGYITCKSVEWVSSERIIAIWTVILGVATCILGFATIGLWQSTKDLVEGADRTAERQLRAYISCIPIDVVNIEPGKELGAAFVFQNDGLTPAHDLTQSSVIKLTEWPLPKNFSFPQLNTDPRSKNNLSPRSRMISFAERFDHTLCQGRTITQNDILQILQAPSHGRRLVMFGEVKYRDAFEQKRLTRFCASFNGNPDLLKLATQGNWQLIAQVVRQPGYGWAWEMADQHNIIT